MKSVLTQKRELQEKGWIYTTTATGLHIFISPDTHCNALGSDLQKVVDKAMDYESKHPANQPAPSTAQIPDVLAEKNAEIDALKAENARIIGLVMNAISDLEDGSPTIALTVLDKIVQSTKQAPAAPQAEAVTLTWVETPNHDADDFTQADLEFFARQARPEKFWYYEELSPRQKAAIAARRQALGL